MKLSHREKAVTIAWLVAGATLFAIGEIGTILTDHSNQIRVIRGSNEPLGADHSTTNSTDFTDRKTREVAK